MTGKVKFQRPPSEQASAAGEGDAAGFLRRCVRVVRSQMPVRMADERGGEGGDGAEQAFGIAGAFVEMRGGEDLAVEPGGEVGVLVEERDLVGGHAVAGDGDEAHEDPIAEEAATASAALFFHDGLIEIERWRR